MAAPTLHTVFQDGTKHNPATVICGFLDSTQMSGVDMLVRAANLNRMQQVQRHTEQTAKPLTDRVQSQVSELFSEDERPKRERVISLHTAFNREIGVIKRQLPFIKALTLDFAYGDFAVQFLQRFQNPELDVDNATLDRYAVFFHKNLAHAKLWQAELGDADQAERNYQIAVSQMQELAISEGLIRRFRENAPAQAQDGAQIPALVARHFEVVHASQRACITSGSYEDHAFVELASTHRHSFSQERLREQEMLAQRNQITANYHLIVLWQAIVGQVHPGPNPPQTPMEIRAWMNDPQNADALAQVHTLNLDFGFSALGEWSLRHRRPMLPAEIGQLRGLRSLICRGLDQGGGLIGLPNELAHLTQLRDLVLDGNNFTRVPPVLAEMGAVNIHFINNRVPITELPEAVARTHCNGWRAYLVDFARGMYGLDHTLFRISFREGVPPQDERSLRLDYGALTDLPFFLWFKELFSIPYIPIMGIDWMILISLRDCLNNWGMYWLNFCLLPLTLTRWFAMLALNLAVNLPIFSLNLFINWAIVPIVELFRSCLGYSSMVHIEPEPQPAQAG